jgi:hypothetical protein
MEESKTRIPPTIRIAKSGKGDGSLSEPRFHGPSSITYDPITNSSYVLDTLNHRIARVDHDVDLVSTFVKIEHKTRHYQILLFPPRFRTSTCFLAASTAHGLFIYSPTGKRRVITDCNHDSKLTCGQKRKPSLLTSNSTNSSTGMGFDSFGNLLFIDQRGSHVLRLRFDVSRAHPLARVAASSDDLKARAEVSSDNLKVHVQMAWSGRLIRTLVGLAVGHVPGKEVEVYALHTQSTIMRLHPSRKISIWLAPSVLSNTAAPFRVNRPCGILVDRKEEILYVADVNRIFAVDMRTKATYMLPIACDNVRALVLQERSAEMTDVCLLERIRCAESIAMWPPGLCELIEGYSRRVIPPVLLALDEGNHCILRVQCVTRRPDGSVS